MSFTFNIGELLALLPIVFFAGAFYAKAKAHDKTLAELKAEHMRSATEQGTRLGDLTDKVGTLLDWKARTEGAADRERELSGVVRR